MDELREALMTLASVAVSAITVYLGVWLRDRAARLRLDSALGRAAGLIIADPRVQAAGAAALGSAAEVGVRYLRRTMPDTLAQLGVPAGRVAEMVTGEAARALVRLMPPGGAAAAVAAHVGIEGQ